MNEPVRNDTSDPFKGIRIVNFSGNVDDWPKWSQRFMAAAKVKKFVNIIDSSMTVPPLSENIQTEDRAIRDLSQAAYCCLLHCMEDDISFTFVETAKLELTRYEPKQYGTLLDLKRSFLTKSLQECENNPDTLYLELEKIQQRIGCISEDRIKDNEMIAQILNQTPSVYENKVNHIKHQIDSGKELTLVEVLGYLKDKYLSLKKEDILDSRTSNNTKA